MKIVGVTTFKELAVMTPFNIVVCICAHSEVEIIVNQILFRWCIAMNNVLVEKEQFSFCEMALYVKTFAPVLIYIKIRQTLD